MSKDKSPVIGKLTRYVSRAGSEARQDADNVAFVCLFADITGVEREQGEAFDYRAEMVCSLGDGFELLLCGIRTLLEKVPEGNEREAAKAELTNGIMRVFDALDGKQIDDEDRPMN